MRSLVLATSNPDKVKEIKNIINNLSLDIIPVDSNFSPEETGSTFEENAYIKAFEAAKLMNTPALADDSGLVVDALDGAPGIFSSRYATTTQSRIDRVLSELTGVESSKRTARFICAMCIVDPEGNTLISCQGVCEGIIIDELKGSHGFGYDPIFYIPEFKKTLAELTLEEKNNVSHRSKALEQIIAWLKDNF